MKQSLLFLAWVNSAFFETAFAAGEMCPYVFAADSKISVINYPGFDPERFTELFVTGLKDKAGYILIKPETQQVAPHYTISYVVEADGKAKRVNPAMTLIFRARDGTQSRDIMVSKRVRDDDQRIPSVMGLIESAVKKIPRCPGWVP